jgi:hypothetical protein
VQEVFCYGSDQELEKLQALALKHLCLSTGVLRFSGRKKTLVNSLLAFVRVMSFLLCSLIISVPQQKAHGYGPALREETLNLSLPVVNSITNDH